MGIREFAKYPSVACNAPAVCKQSHPAGARTNEARAAEEMEFEGILEGAYAYHTGGGASDACVRSPTWNTKECDVGCA